MKTVARGSFVQARSRFSALFSCLLLQAIPGIWAPVGAQGSLQVKPNAKVRITAPGMGLEGAVGQVREVTAEGLLVDFDSGLVSVPVPAAHIWDLEVAEGVGGHPIIGMIMGGLVGGVVGSAVRSHHEATRVEKCPFGGIAVNFFYTPPTCQTRFQPAYSEGHAVAGLAVGALVGFFVGRRIRTDVWRPGSLPGVALAVEPLAGPGYQGLSLEVSF